MCLVGLIAVHCHSPFESSVRLSPKWEEGKITHSKTPQWGRRMGHESLAAHFASFASLDDAHVDNRQTNIHAELLSKRMSRAIKQVFQKKTFMPWSRAAPCLSSSLEFRMAQQLCSFPGCNCLFISVMVPHPCNSAHALPATGSLFTLRHKAHFVCETYFCPPVLIVYHKLCCSQWFDIKLIFNSSLGSSLEW